MLVFAVMAGTVCQAYAGTASVDVCRQQGLVAERLAEARERGMSMQAAISSVIEYDPLASVTIVNEAADLLFHRFRYLPTEQVALEFMAACLDDAE